MTSEEDRLADELASLRLDRSTPLARSCEPRTRRRWRASRHGRLGGRAVLAHRPLGVGGFFVFREGSGRIFSEDVDIGAVTLMSPSQSDVTLVATGYVYARKKANVAPKLGGRLARFFVDEGSTVKEGQVVAELESADAQAALAQMRADILAGARQGRARARRRGRRADAPQARDRTCMSREAGTQAALDDAKARLGAVVDDAGLGAGGRGRGRGARARHRRAAREHQGARAVRRHGAAQAGRGRRGGAADDADRHPDAGVARRPRGAGRRRRGAVPQGQGGDAGGDHPRRVPRQALPRAGLRAAADRRSLEGVGDGEGQVHRRLDGRAARHGGEGELSDQGARRRGAQGGAEADRAGRRGGRRGRAQGGVHDRRRARQGRAGDSQGAVRRGRARARATVRRRGRA